MAYRTVYRLDRTTDKPVEAEVPVLDKKTSKKPLIQTTLDQWLEVQ